MSWLLLLLLGCGSAPVDPIDPPPGSVVSPRERVDDVRAEVRDAFARDAWRRERRFRAAVDGGASRMRPEQAEIDAGRWSVGALHAVGGELFARRFTAAEGWGSGDGLWRVQRESRGGPDAFRCAACHWRGGPAGGGDGADLSFLDGDGDATSSALARNPTALVGAGWLQLAAEARTAELQDQRAAALIEARRAGEEVAVELNAGGISYGSLVVGADGTVDASGLIAVDPDLVVKPFGRKGHFATLREVVVDELATHLGLSADPADPDGDGVAQELTEGEVTAIAAWLALQEVPTEELPERSDLLLTWSAGQRAFHELGCADCHVPTVLIEDPTYRLRSPTGQLTLDLGTEASEPRPVHTEAGWRLPLFTDLRRHEMGPELAESRDHRGVPGSHWLTPPLWGVARSRPYLHDGRAATLEQAILLHGGEAQASRDAYAALHERDRAPVRVYLTALTRARRFEVP